MTRASKAARAAALRQAIDAFFEDTKYLATPSPEQQKALEKAITQKIERLKATRKLKSPKPS
jgi:hypothetical protein